MFQDLKPKLKLFFLVALAVFISVGGILLLRITGPEPAPSPTPVAQQTPPPAPSPQPQTLDTSDWQTYRNEEYGFEVKYPIDWEETEFSSHGSFEITAKGTHRNVSLNIRTPLESAGSAFINTAFDKDILLDGAPARYKESMWVSGNDKFFQIVIQWKRNGGGVIIFDYLEENKDGKNIFDQILSTFRFVEK